MFSVNIKVIDKCLFLFICLFLFVGRFKFLIFKIVIFFLKDRFGIFLWENVNFKIDFLIVEIKNLFIFCIFGILLEVNFLIIC